MAGILDFLNSDDARLGVGLLAAGGPTTDPNQSGLGQRLAAGLQFADQSRRGKLQEELLRSQMAENDAQSALRQNQLARQAQMDNYYLGSGFGSGQAAMPQAGTGGGVAEGAALKQAIGAPADAPRPPQGKFAEWSQQFKIPVDALVTDYMSNGGKGIADMLYKAGRPDMQVSNGYAYDKNNVGAGYLPQLNVSQDGKSTLVQIGSDGLPVVSAPRGAVNTFGNYRRTEASLKPIKVFNPDTQREEYTNEADVAGGGAPQSGGTLGMRNNNPGNLRVPGQSTGFQQFGSPEQGLQAIDRQLQIYGQRDGINTIRGAISKWAPPNENNTNAYVDRVSKMLGVSPDAKIDLSNPYVRQAMSTGIMLQENGSQILTGGGGGRSSSGNFAAGPSASETASNEAQKTWAVDTAKADVVRDTARQATQKLQGQIGAAATLAGQLLEQKPTGSGAGSLVDQLGNFVGQPSKSSDTAQQLEALSGWMVANVPRMEGPQSDADVRNYAKMAGQVGDRTLPISTRKAALQTVMELQQKYAELNGGQASQTPTAPVSKLKTPPSQSDLQNTALKYGMTVDQVKQKLGIQ